MSSVARCSYSSHLWIWNLLTCVIIWTLGDDAEPNKIFPNNSISSKITSYGFYNGLWLRKMGYD